MGLALMTIGDATRDELDHSRASERLETGRETLVSTRAVVNFIAAIGAAGRLDLRGRAVPAIFCLSFLVFMKGKQSEISNCRWS